MSWISVLMMMSLPPLQRIEMPETLIKVSKIVPHKGGLFVLDVPGKAIYSLDRQGRELHHLNRVGSGPGEFQGPADLAFDGSVVYVADMRRQMLLRYDHNLNFLKANPLPGLCRKVVASKDALYVLMYYAKGEHMIGKYDRDMNLVKTFGTALSPGSKFFGLQAGEILIHDKFLYFVHTFRPVLEIFSLQGELLEKKEIPGFKGSFFDGIDLKDLNFHNSIRYNVIGMAYKEDMLTLRIIDLVEERKYDYRYDLKLKTWKKLEAQAWLIELWGQWYTKKNEKDRFFLEQNPDRSEN